MPTALTTTVTELPDSRVRVQVQVPPGELERTLEGKARQLARELRLPGFRRGKVPTPLVIQRMGREAVLEEAVRDHLSDWYVDAIAASGIAPVGDPHVDLGDLPPSGQALDFSFEIGVLPSATLGEYKGLEVGRREASVDDERLQQELDGLRERLARLETAERPAGRGDFIVMDYVGSLVQDGPEGEQLEPFQGGEGRDQLLELGSGNLIPGFEDGLLGASAAEQRTVRVSFPDPYPSNPELSGRAASFSVTVKEVKSKLLPDLDEDFAIDAGFDSIQELREDIRTRLLEADEERVRGEFREAAMDAAVARAQVEVPPALVQARAREMWERTLHTLSHQGISREAYLQIAGHEGEEQVLAEIAPDAEQGLRREAVVTAIVEAEAIDPGDEDLLEELAPIAEREGTDPQKLLAQLRSKNRLQELREEVAARRAVELIAQEAKPIPIEQAQAREKLWTPEQQGAGEAPASAPPRLWTPDR